MTKHCPAHPALNYLKEKLTEASHDARYYSFNIPELTELLVCYTETKEQSAEVLKTTPFRSWSLWTASMQKSFTENIIQNATAHLLSAFIAWIKEVDHDHPAPIIIEIVKNKNSQEAQILIQEFLKDNSLEGYDILLFLRELDHVQIQFLMDVGVDFHAKFNSYHQLTGRNDYMVSINDIRTENLSLVTGKLDFSALQFTDRWSESSFWDKLTQTHLTFFIQHGLDLLPVAHRVVAAILAFPEPLALKDTLILCIKHISPHQVLPLLASLETDQVKTLLDLGANFKVAFKPYTIDYLPNIPLSTLLLLEHILDFHSLQITSAAEGNVSQFFKNISSAQLEFYVAHGLNLEPLFDALPFNKLAGLANKMHADVKEWCFSHYNLPELISHKYGAEVLDIGSNGEYFQAVINSPKLPQIISSLSDVQKGFIFAKCDVNSLSHLVTHGFNLNETIHRATTYHWYSVKQFFKNVSIAQLQFFTQHGLDLNHFFNTLSFSALVEITKAMHAEVKDFCFSQYKLVELIEHNHASEVLAAGLTGEYFQNIINSDTLPQTIAALNQEQTARVLKTFSNENLENLIKHGFNLNKAIKSLPAKESASFINKRDVPQLKFIAKHVDDLRSIIEDSFTQIRSDIINKAISTSTGSCELKTKQAEINDQYLAQLAHDEARLNFYKELGVSIDVDNTIFIGFNNIHGEWSSNVIDYIKNKFQIQSQKPVIVIPLNYESTSNTHYLECFHTFINPGAGDSFLYGRHDHSVKINVGYMFHRHLLDHEQAYQNVINHAIEHNKPYIGICNGNQHLILNQGGYVHWVGAPSSAQIQLIPGSITYFLALNKTEQAKGVAQGFYPDKIEFEVSLAHSFAGVPEQLGHVELGGTISDGKIVEAVALSFYQVGFQFHPENRYDGCERNANLLHNMFRLFLSSKDVDMPCVNEHLSKAFKSSFEHAQCPAETMEQPLESSRDILGEALNECGVCH